jgi:hypothetical protein
LEGGVKEEKEVPEDLNQKAEKNMKCLFSPRNMPCSWLMTINAEPSLQGSSTYRTSKVCSCLSWLQTLRKQFYVIALRGSTHTPLR